MTNQINLMCPYCDSQNQFKLSETNCHGYNEKVVEGIKILDAYDNEVNSELEYKVYSCDRQLLVVKLDGDQIAGYFPSAKFNPRTDLDLIPEEIRNRFETVVIVHNIDFKIVEDSDGSLLSSRRGIENEQTLIDIINCIAPNEEKSTKDSLENIQLPKNNLIRCALIFIEFGKELSNARILSHTMALHFVDCHLNNIYRA